MKYLKVLLLIVSVAIIGLFADQQAAAQSGRQSFSQLITKTLTVTNAATFQDGLTVDTGGVTVTSGGLTVTAGGATVTAGGLTVAADGADITGDITLENDETISNATDGFITLGGGIIHNTTTVTVTNGQTITPTVYSAYRLNAAGAVTITIAACSNDGQPLYLFGEDNVTITIADSNIRTSDGAAGAVGQYDLWTGMCFNTEWIEIANPANS